MESKNIERLFQEKLKDLEITPNSEVWNKIEQSMAKPKKSKKGFIWFFSGSVAALLLLGLFLFRNHPSNIQKSSPQKNIVKNNTKIDSNFIKEKSLPSVAKNKLNLSKKQSAQTKKTILESPKKSTNSQIVASKSINDRNSTTTQAIAANNINKETAIKAGIEKLKEIVDNTITKGKKSNSQKTAIVANNDKKETIKKQDLEEVVNASKEVIEIKKIKKHWSIAPVISELVYNTFSNKSSVDNRLDNANKNGNSSTAFGLKVAYQVSKKWRVQTGIHKMNLSQTTENIALAGISRSAFLVNSNQKILDVKSFGNDVKVSKANLLSESNALIQHNNNNDKLKQIFGYIEVPLEINYQLFETKKVQFHVIGGLSTLFLTTNNLQVQATNFSYSGGQATNLNKINFSFNLGTAAEYHFSNRWFFNLSPMLKMQTQTFNNTNNKPYLLGISTGINYKF